jgi:hypothetical protein
MSTAEHQAASNSGEHKPGYKPIEEEVLEVKTGSDLGKVALFVALLAVILMVMLYFSQNQNITAMSEKLDGVQSVKQEIVAVQGQISTLEQEMGALKDLPKEAKKVIISGLLNESASKIQYLSTQMETEEQQAKLLQVQKMLEEVHAGME